MIKKIAIITQDLLFSRYCYICLKLRSHLFSLCRPCLEKLPYIQISCPTCGVPLLINQQFCGQCLQTNSPIHRAHPTFIYEGVIKDQIIQLKYHNGLYLNLALARLMQHKLRNKYQEQPWPQALISVPLHSSKMRKRGYNQSLELSRALSKLINIPEQSRLVKKIKRTADQATLPLDERKKNIKGVFSVLKPLPKHIAIIDDVMTTGETVKQLARTLKKHGAKRVDVWCLARAINKL